MSKVKFIQWGTTASPKGYYQRNSGYGTPAVEFQDLLDTYKGGLIFATYWNDEELTSYTLEIWANGILYPVGGGSGSGGAANIIYGTEKVGADGQTVGTAIPGAHGCIYIYTGEDNTQTAYYWDEVGRKWLPFNVDAENVYFPNGFYRTEGWGWVKPTTGGVPKNDLADLGGDPLNLVEVFEHYLINTIYPAVNISCAGNSSNFDIDYVLDAPVSVNCYSTDPTGLNPVTYAKGAYVLVNSPLWVQALYDAEVKISTAESENKTDLAFGPITVSNIDYGCTYTDKDGNPQDDRNKINFKGEQAYVTSLPNTACTHGDKTLTVVNQASLSVASGSSVAAQASDDVTATSQKLAVASGTTTFTAVGASDTTWERTLYAKGDDVNKTPVTTINVPAIEETEIKAYNNKGKLPVDIDVSGSINPYNGHTFDISGWATSAGIEDASASTVIHGYLPVFYSVDTIDNRVSITDIKGKSQLTEYAVETCSYPEHLKVTQRYTQNCVKSIVFAVPSSASWKIHLNGVPVDVSQIQSNTVADFILDGSGQGVSYTILMLLGGYNSLGWAASNNSNVELTLQ